MWQPDGWARTRIGVLTPHADVWPEAEFGAMAPDGISIHAARVPVGAYKPGGAMDRERMEECGAAVRSGTATKRDTTASTLFAVALRPRPHLRRRAAETAAERAIEVG